MSKVKVAITTLIEIDTDEWIKQSENHGYSSTDEIDVINDVTSNYNMEDRIDRWAWDVIEVKSEDWEYGTW
jgi:hypothetical protein